jgi:hypothetical protein
MKNGMLRDDACKQDRLASKMPVVSVILSLFQAEHNLICTELEKNYPKVFNGLDEVIYRQARSINIATFILVIMYDYVGGINGSPRWALERMPLNAQPFPQNPEPMHCSVEFKLMYQFHASIPDLFFKKLGSGDQSPETLLAEALETPSGKFGANSTPGFLEASEIRSIQWGREVGACSLNDMRSMLKLARYKSFKQLNSDPEVIKKLQKFYPGGIDTVELYVGVTVEQWTEKNKPCKGWSLPPTLYMAIRNDAISSVIGDKFHTGGITDKALTKWGKKHAIESGRLAILINRHTKMEMEPSFNFYQVPK